MIRVSTIALATGLVASASSAMAQDRVEIGTLECRGSTTSFVIGSVTDLNCGYRPVGGGPVEPYRATMRRAGVDIGFNQQIVVVWGVWAPSRGQPRWDLSGNYAGAQASATVGVGVGANALIGGSGNTIALQPLSGQAQTGLSAAAGVASLELHATR
jgi:uncharacterized protein DUF992